MYYKKLDEFFDSKGLKKKETAEILGVSAQMMGRYLKGKDKINSDFILSLVQHFPDIDLKYIFASESEITNALEEPPMSYGINKDNLIEELENIEKKLSVIRGVLARKSHEK